MLDLLKRQVCDANLELVRRGLVEETWGNASAIDRDQSLVVIKPSGVSYDQLKPEDMVVVSLADGEIVDGRYKPSSDTDTHRVLYRSFSQVGAIVHTHSLHATAWAQALREIPCLGTTHADHWHGAVPCTRLLSPEEINVDYEAQTGRVICERFRDLDPLAFPGVLVAAHGPFTWGRRAADAVQAAVVLEYIARLARETLHLQPGVPAICQDLLDRHYLRKHGPGATYGQGATSGPRLQA